MVQCKPNYRTISLGTPEIFLIDKQFDGLEPSVKCVYCLNAEGVRRNRNILWDNQ